jgi:hypothetical protein
MRRLDNAFFLFMAAGIWLTKESGAEPPHSKERPAF